MCESTVLLKGNNGLNTIMPDAVRMTVDPGLIRCTNIIGEQVVLENVRVVEMDLLRHRIIIEAI